MSNLVGMMVGNQVNQLKGEIAEEKSDVDWNNFNYPPGIRLIHFEIVDIPNESNHKYGKVYFISI